MMMFRRPFSIAGFKSPVSDHYTLILSLYLSIYLSISSIALTTTTTTTTTVLKEAVPLPLDSTKFILHILLAFFPLGFLHSKLPRGIVLDAYNLVAGVLLAQFLFAEAWINVGLAALLTNLLVRVLPRKLVGPVTFFLIMIFMVMTMVERLSCDYLSYRMDYTGAQMMVTIKLTSFAWCYTDGGKSSDGQTLKSLQQEYKTEQDSRKKRLLKAKVEKFKNKYDTMPNILTFMAWTYQFSGYPVGPALELREYLRGTTSLSLSLSLSLRRLFLVTYSPLQQVPVNLL
jgi:lysophospholipid acyltransferase